MRAALPILVACLVAGCGTASEQAGPSKDEAGVLVFGGTLNPSGRHPPGGYYAMHPDGTAAPQQVGPTFGEPRSFAWTTADLLESTNSTPTVPKPSS